jgi:hypothetical protein
MKEVRAMSKPGREDSLLSVIEAGLSRDDPGLTALFDAFAHRGPAPGTPRGPAAGRAHRTASAKRILALVLVSLALLTVLAAVSGSAFGPAGRVYGDTAGAGRRTAAAVDTWAVRQGRAIRARICQSIPLPAGATCL